MRVDISIRDVVSLLEVKRTLMDKGLDSDIKRVDSFIKKYLDRIQTLCEYTPEKVPLEEIQHLKAFLEFDDYREFIRDIFYLLSSRKDPRNLTTIVKEMNDADVTYGFIQGASRTPFFFDAVFPVVKALNDKETWKVFIDWMISKDPPNLNELIQISEYVSKYANDLGIIHYFDKITNILRFAVQTEIDSETLRDLVYKLRIFADKYPYQVKRIVLHVGYLSLKPDALLEVMYHYEPKFIWAALVGRAMEEHPLFSFLCDGMFEHAIKGNENTIKKIHERIFKTLEWWLDDPKVCMAPGVVQLIRDLKDKSLLKSFFTQLKKTVTEYAESSESQPLLKNLVGLRTFLTTRYKGRVGDIFYVCAFAKNKRNINTIIKVLEEIDDEYLYERISEGLADKVLKGKGYSLHIPGFFANLTIGRYFMTKVGEEEISSLLSGIYDLHKSSLILENDIPAVYMNENDVREWCSQRDVKEVKETIKANLRRLLIENRKGPKTLKEAGTYTAALAYKIWTTKNDG